MYPFIDCSLFSQNAELLSSLDSASVRIFKLPSFPAGPVRLQPSSGHQLTGSPPVFSFGASLGHPPQTLDSPHMATIQEDPSLDSHLGTEELEEAFGRPAGAGATRRSFEDLTDKSPMSRSQRSKLLRLQRQHQIDSKETQC